MILYNVKYRQRPEHGSRLPRLDTKPILISVNICPSTGEDRSGDAETAGEINERINALKMRPEKENADKPGISGLHI